jgi:deazaflavin-dependent oxidoreductase (nitroreductase family)
MPGKFTDALRGTNTINVTVTGRVTGRQISNPVLFVQENGTIFLLPVRGSDTDWFKNVRAVPRLRLTTDGASVTATAAPITDRARVQEVVGKFRAKYGAGPITATFRKLDVAVEVSVPESAG